MHVYVDPLSGKRPCCSGLGHGGSDESLVDGVITSEDALLLPDHVPVLPHKLEKETPTPVSGPPPPDTIANGSLPVCTPPTASRKPECDGHSKPHKKRPSSTLKSQQSLKSSSTQIQQAAGNDCCVHCVLACLFCELASLCSALTQCLACGAECDAVCCCGEACGGLICCSEDPCSAILDCAILEDCCQSSDCMEICLECCSICFPT
ncbi:myoD family inhibitor [Trichomycterus rosablanca]|uniref:myoD family inhibitor n=1 Tax=Trichomycterus rosablanca TaxID=2290929 RepID=UPI002F358A2E